MFLEQIALFTLQLRTKLQNLINFLARETNSQLGQIFFVCCLIVLTGLLYYTWVIPSGLWLKLIYSLVYILCFLLSVSAIYFILKRKRIRNNSGTLEVYTQNDPDLKKFQNFNLRSIPLTEVQKKAVYNAFSEKYLNGDYQSFQSLMKLRPVLENERLVWKDNSPKRPDLVNRQTLLEFLSHLLAGFENLENHQMIALVEHYFILKNQLSTQQKLSSKNISDWRMNKAAYLKEISRLFQHHLR